MSIEQEIYIKRIMDAMEEITEYDDDPCLQERLDAILENALNLAALDSVQQ